MKILMIVPHYIPDLGPSAPLFGMLSKELEKRDHEILVLTTVPHYPTGEVPKPYRNKFLQQSFEGRTEIIRVRIPSLKRSNFFGRLLQFIVYQLGATWSGLWKTYDVVFVANPALWVWLPFAVLCVMRHKPAIFSIFDVYPDVGIRLGIFRNKPVIQAVKKLEQYCLNHSKVVRIISESFRPAINRLGVPDTKISLVYDWVDTELIQPLPKENKFRKTQGLSNHFIVLYAGNLGLSQGLELILSTAEKLTDDHDIIFVFVGDGAGRKALLEEAEKRKLMNVKFIPFQPREELPFVLASADVSLVVLKRGVGFDSLPNKILSILASNRPIIASVDKGCEAWEMVQQAEAGLCVEPEDPSEMAKAILKLKQDTTIRDKMGENGREWALTHHSPGVAAETFEKIFLSIQ